MSFTVYALLAAVFAAATALLAKLGVSGVPSNLATAVRTLVVLVFSTGIVLARGEASALWRIDGRSLGFLLGSGVCTGVSWLCYFKALSLGPASRVAPLDKLSLPLTLLLAWLVLGEALSPRIVVGALLMTVGALLTLGG